MDVLLNYFPDLTPVQIEQFTQLQPLYREWNEKINVISRKDIDNLYLHHVIHSLSIACFIRFKNGTKILDAGTGGGFPGIPLAIMFPSVHFYLADSIGKKVTVVKAVSEQLRLKNVEANQIRVESLNEKFDFVVSRAVTQLPLFESWVSKLIHPVDKNTIRNGILYLKGGDVNEEIDNFRDRTQIISISDYFSDPFFIEKKIIYLAAH